MNNRIIFLFTFIIAWLLFVPTSHIISNPTYDGWLRNLLILFLFYYFRSDIGGFYRGTYKKFNLAMTSYCAICILSIFINSNTIGAYDGVYFKDGESFDIVGIVSPKKTIYSCLSLIGLTLFVERVIKIDKVEIFLHYLSTIMFFLLVWVDFDALMHIVVNHSIGGYIVGTKFIVGYMNMFYITLYYLIHPKMDKIQHKIILIGLILLMLYVSIHVECSTMVLVSFLCIIFFFFIPFRSRYYLSSGKLMIMLILLLDVGFFFFTTWALQFNIVQNFIVDVLHEDLTLTGRLGIFENIMESFKNGDTLWFGYGYGNSTVISMYYGCGYNPQNGIIELFLNVGLLGCAAFLSMIYIGFQQITVYDWYNFAVIVFVYIMVIVSMIEVPFDNVFIFFVILLLTKRKHLAEDYYQISKWQLKL